MARLAAVEAALDRLDDLADEYPDHLRAGRPAAGAVRARGEPRLAGRRRRPRRGRAGAARPPGDPAAPSSTPQREAVIRLRDDGVISDEVLRRVERDLDLEALPGRAPDGPDRASRATLRRDATPWRPDRTA